MNSEFSIIFSSPNPVFSCASLICIIIINILSRLKLNSSASFNDNLSQLFIALNSLTNKILCPEFSSYNGIKGYYYYPTGFYWLLSKFQYNLNPFNIPTLSKWVNDLLPQENVEAKNKIKTYVNNVFTTSNFFFPIGIQILVTIYFIIVPPNNWISLLTYISSLVIINNTFSNSDYLFNTRNIGIFLYYIFSIPVIILLSSPNFSDIYADLFMQASIIFVLILVIILLPISSQRGTQLFLVFSGALMFTFNSFINNYILAIFMSTLIVFQIPSLNIVDYIKAQLYNRVHERTWSYNTYGLFRYKLFAISKELILDTLVDCLTLKFIHKNFYGPYDKKFLIILPFLYRTYFYLIPFMFIPNIGLNMTIKLLLLSTIVPAFIVYFSPLQGYGPPSLYLHSNLALATIILGHCFVNLTINIESTDAKSVLYLSIFVVIDCLVLLFGYCRIFIPKLFQIIFIPSKRVSDFSLATPSLSKSLISINSRIDSILLEYSAQNPATIFTPECHSQALIEFLSNSYFFPARTNLNVAFRMIDNFFYGFYFDFKGFSIDCRRFSSIRPNIILLDRSKYTTISYLKYLSKINLLYRADYKDENFILLVKVKK